jgi:hypothetical protein
LKTFSDSHLVRVYPKGTRVDSSNFNPLPYLKNGGAQICGLNMQTFPDPFNFANFGYFAQSGKAGYVAKPTQAAQPCTVQLCFHGARNIPLSQRDILDPYLQISIVSDTGVSKKVTSKTVNNNGLNPDFEFECQFEVADPLFSVLVVELYDADPGKDDMIAFYAGLVDTLQSGIRALPLYGRQYYQIRGGAHVLVSCVIKKE